ncbi:MAG: DUF2130 domain-containing protein [Candidatus Woesebacteria bacterium]|nr:DUF2130 domain-containing protein [Candidatus Woesebacteria bacterium]
MQNKIIITANEPITCPKCGHDFPLDAGITRQTIERYETEFEEVFAAQRKEMEEALAREAERKATRQFSEQIGKLQEQLSDSRKLEREAKELIVKAQVEAKSKATEEFAQEKKALAEELQDKEAKLRQFREQELDLRKQKKYLEEQQHNLQLDLQRKLDEERVKISEQISQKEAERFSMIEAEYKKKIEDAQRANEDLRRKLDQGSQQLQGEVLELELEHILATSFVHDQIDEVKKGVRGADILQTVRTPMGQVCGKIIWEAKRAENWTDRWLQKLKDDQQEAKADIAVLVTTAMPKGVTEPFVRIGDVWVVAPHVMRPVAETLRVILLEAHKLKLVNTGRNEKMESLYNYLASTQFSQKVRTMLESFESMRSDLEAEKRAMQKIWAKRQTQLERVTGSMVTVVGELQGIAHDSLPELDTIDVLALPTGELSPGD